MEERSWALTKNIFILKNTHKICHYSWILNFLYFFISLDFCEENWFNMLKKFGFCVIVIFAGEQSKNRPYISIPGESWGCEGWIPSIDKFFLKFNEVVISLLFSLALSTSSEKGLGLETVHFSRAASS